MLGLRTATSFRALCVELSDAYLRLLRYVDKVTPLGYDPKEDSLLVRVRAELAAPKQMPTREELREMFDENDWNYISPETFEDIALTVLGEWGRPAVEPVPVSERPILKSDPFNNANGHCWCGISNFIDETGDHPVSCPASWELREPCPQDDCVLPYWALPVPQEGG